MMDHIEKVYRWVPPPQGTVKLNFDGGLSRGRMRGVGGIFRDPRVLLCSRTRTCSEVGSTAYDGEAQALAAGIIYAWNMGFSRLWVEGDVLYLVDAVEGRRSIQWYGEDAVELIRSWMDAFPERPALTLIAREANSAADALVKHVREDVSTAMETRWDKGARLPEKVAAAVDLYRERNGYSYIRRRCFQQQQRHPAATTNSCLAAPIF